MLLERASGLADKITAYEALKTAGDEALQFQTRANQITGASDKISRARAALKEMRDAGVSVDFPLSDGVTLAERAKELRTAMTGNPSVIHDPPFNLKYEFLDRLINIATFAERTIAASWKTHVRKSANFGPSDILDALFAIPQFRASVTRIRQSRAAVEALGEVNPADPKAAIKQLEALVEEQAKAWSDFSAKDISPNVVKFIRESASDGASLASYSDEVRKWLTDNDLIASFRIRLK
ncbi:hypothetical protein [Rhizobium ruizarguesonis]|uniref:hypothetical protein n=1 Tax=Rhizobium ruizarguesonis TaxID=2081791 RepID=UPI001CF3CB65|nr:hypothetical protein [Rhizobium ruizarguesonis]MCB2399372.1 hypothetical protein [Rhizobium ruizarguesonis]